MSVFKKNPVPELELAQYDGSPLQMVQQFCNTVESVSLGDDVKLTFSKTLVTGKAESAIAEFAYSGKFGQPQIVIAANPSSR